MADKPYLISGRNTLIHKLRKLDLLIVNGRRDPVLLVMYNEIEIYDGKIPENKLDAKRMDMAKVDISSSENFSDYRPMLFIQTLNNKEYKVDYTKAGTDYFITIHQESTF
ncbi:hypothetical protein [Glaciecola sp. 33A]|jgi:hypothetical protein|uniref:hypothetical protein n=1 Tax=Glaciecola sp. 33A TaxID=2057807 RepID=UPI000C332F4A|nr:hypothetical protein [Glaciecola sp. 33A]PKI01486.1 hypothetical protein CXF81_10755 [Glaciecola sp. 33A]